MIGGRGAWLTMIVPLMPGAGLAGLVGGFCWRPRRDDQPLRGAAVSAPVPT
jgi:hypothetical protein